jgi:hypothetical protein
MTSLPSTLAHARERSQIFHTSISNKDSRFHSIIAPKSGGNWYSDIGGRTAPDQQDGNPPLVP